MSLSYYSKRITLAEAVTASHSAHSGSERKERGEVSETMCRNQSKQEKSEGCFFPRFIYSSNTSIATSEASHHESEKAKERSKAEMIACRTRRTDRAEAVILFKFSYQTKAVVPAEAATAASAQTKRRAPRRREASQSTGQ